MRALAPAFASLVFLLAGLCPVEAGVTVHHSRSVDFSNYATFAWLEGAPAADPEVERQIRQAIESQLVSKGLSRSAEAPDIYIRSMAGGRDGKVDDIDILGIPAGVDQDRDPSDASGIETRRVTVGTLVVLILDGETRLQVWQGVATDNLDDSTKRSVKKAQKLIRKMFADFPPGAE